MISPRLVTRPFIDTLSCRYELRSLAESGMDLEIGISELYLLLSKLSKGHLDCQ